MSKISPLHARVQIQAADCSALDVFHALNTPALRDVVDVDWPAHRERVFSPATTVSMFVDQALRADGSCQVVVNDAALERLIDGAPTCSTATGGYCRARARLPIELIQQLTQATAECVGHQTPDGWHETGGRRVRIVDGTTITLADTPENQARYPQPASQKPGAGFPICRLVGLFDMADGTLADAAIGCYQGKGAHE